jgi:hypothetical protein
MDFKFTRQTKWFSSSYAVYNSTWYRGEWLELEDGLQATEKKNTILSE